MNCINCNASFDTKMLYRTLPLGQPCNDWICKDCLGNIKEKDLDNKILLDIEKAVLSHNNNKKRKKSGSRTLF